MSELNILRGFSRKGRRRAQGTAKKSEHAPTQPSSQNIRHFCGAAYKWLLQRVDDENWNALLNSCRTTTQLLPLMHEPRLFI